MAVVHKDLGLRIQAVNQIPSPQIRTKDRFPDIALRNHLSGFNRKAFVIETCINQLSRAEPSAVHARPQAENECEHQPKVTSKLKFQLLHPRAKTLQP